MSNMPLADKGGMPTLPPPFMPLFVICLLVLGYQGRDMLLSPQLWGEDGPIFFQQQLGHVLPRLFEPYAGYLHFVPRLVTWLSHVVSIKHQPAFMNTAAWLIAGWSLAFTAHRMNRYVPAWISLAIFAFAPTSGEINGNITNIQWFLQFALFAIVFAPAARPIRAWPAFAITLAMALTGPFSVAFSALFIAAVALVALWPKALRGNVHSEVQAWLRRFDRAAVVALLLGGVLQAVTLASTAQRTGAHADWFGATGSLLGILLQIHILGEPIVPARIWAFIYPILGVMFLTGSGVKIEAKASIALITIAGVGLALAGVVVQPQPYNLSFGFSDRYYLLARISMWWVLYTAFAAHWKEPFRAEAATVMLVIFVGVIVSPGLHRRWAMVPLDWKGHVRDLRQPGHHSIPVNPGSFTIEINTDASGKMSGGPAPQ